MHYGVTERIIPLYWTDVKCLGTVRIYHTISGNNIGVAFIGNGKQAK